MTSNSSGSSTTLATEDKFIKPAPRPPKTLESKVLKPTTEWNVPIHDTSSSASNRVIGVCVATITAPDAQGIYPDGGWRLRLTVDSHLPPSTEFWVVQQQQHQPTDSDQANQDKASRIGLGHCKSDARGATTLNTIVGQHKGMVDLEGLVFEMLRRSPDSSNDEPGDDEHAKALPYVCVARFLFASDRKH